jgi:hypothetical protein
LTQKPPQEGVQVTVHFGRSKTDFLAPGTSTISQVKLQAMTNLTVPPDPNLDYALRYHSEVIENESQTLQQVVGDAKAAEFHLLKVPKGGYGR